MGISDSQALAILKGIKCSLWVYRGNRKRGYHPKIWIIEHLQGNRTIYVGSSNLSDSGMQSNIEAGLIIDGTENETRKFINFWDDLKSSAEEIDDDFIASYKDIENENTIKFKVQANGKVDYKGNYDDLEKFIRGWMQYIEKPEVKRRTEKWRGWYLLPSQGNITVAELRELGRVIRAIEKIPQHQKNNYVDISSSMVGIDNVNNIINTARITYALKHTKADKRDLFIRQQKNYLEHLGFIEEINRGRIKLTERGAELGAALHESEMREAFSHSLENIFWPHGNIYFYRFLLELISRMPDKRLYQSELDLFIIHTYNQMQFENRIEIIKMFRTLPTQDRERLYNWAHSQLGILLKTHRNLSSHRHYQVKIYELMVAFGCTSELKYIDKDSPLESYLTIRT